MVRTARYMNVNKMLHIIKQKFRSNWFIFALISCILLAKIQPQIGAKGGILKPEITVKYFVVSIIFFLSGLSLKTEDLLKAVLQIKLHVFIQGFSLICIPFCMYVITGVLGFMSVNEWLLKGLMSVSCLPPPVSSAVILTKTVGGNEAVAVFNSVVGSFLGLFLTPFSLLYCLGISSTIPISSTMAQLTITVTLPFILGQITHLYMKKSPTRSQVAFNNLNSCLLLFIIYTTFCESFVNGFTLARSTLVLIILIVALIQILFISSVFWFANQSYCSFAPGDTVAAIFCSTHKSLTLGIPMLRIMFSDLPHLSTLSIPLLVYHPLQILIGGLLVTHLEKWMLLKERAKRYRRKVTSSV